MWEFFVNELSYDSDRLANGNTLIGTQSVIYEFNPYGEILWSYEEPYGYLISNSGNVECIEG